jgi:thymidylate kinase
MINKIRYWAFCGNEGTGKTVLSKAFAERCNSFWTYEPNATTEELKTLRGLALTSNANVTEHAREMCLLANRSIHHKLNVQPILDNLGTVVTDRSFLSGMVYANIKTFKFEEWMDLANKANLNLFPEIIIYCTTNKRNMNKNKEGRENDIYDNAPDNIINLIDDIFEKALVFLGEHKLTKHIPIIRFENDFNKPVEENLERLLKVLKTSLT